LGRLCGLETIGFDCNMDIFLKIIAFVDFSKSATSQQFEREVSFL
jgi:hypothetical protein